MLKINFINVKAGEASIVEFGGHGVAVIDLDPKHDEVFGISANMGDAIPLSTLIITHPDDDHLQGFKVLRPKRQRQNRQRDYSRVAGHTVSRSETGAKPTSTAMPVIIGSSADGGSAGGDGGGDDGGGDGDGEPPITAGLASDGDGQQPILLLLIFLLLLFSILRDILAVPFKAPRWLYSIVPSLGCIWVGGQYLFSHSVRHSTYRRELRSLLRDRRFARQRSLRFRVWMGFCLRLRTVLLFLRCAKESLKEVGIEKVPGV